MGWLWVAVILYLSLTPHPPEPVSFVGADKLEHAFAYAMLMLWFCQIYVQRAVRAGLSLALVAMGVGVEILQGMSGYRNFEYADMLANSTGVLVGWGIAQTRLGRTLTILERNDKH